MKTKSGITKNWQATGGRWLLPPNAREGAGHRLARRERRLLGKTVLNRFENVLNSHGFGIITVLELRAESKVCKNAMSLLVRCTDTWLAFHFHLKRERKRQLCSFIVRGEGRNGNRVKIELSFILGCKLY